VHGGNRSGEVSHDVSRLKQERRNTMATPEQRLTENVPGAFYVTNDCLDCALCRELAPTVFRRLDEMGVSIVHHQPVTAEERASAIEAMEGCAVAAIWREGS